MCFSPEIMKTLLIVCCLSMAAISLRAAPPAQGEYIMLVGGPSMYQWEKYKAVPHDHWWANFVRAARLRTEQLRTELGPDAKITWLVYKQGYQDRAKQEHQDLISLINTVRDKFNINLIWFGPGHEVIDYINSGQPRDQVKIVDFEYFGHSNKACFMFDYSNHIDSACKSWLHENDLVKIHRGIFAMNELPELDELVQVGLFNILEERDVQIRGYPVQFDIDVLILFSANPATTPTVESVTPAAIADEVASCPDAMGRSRLRGWF